MAGRIKANPEPNDSRQEDDRLMEGMLDENPWGEDERVDFLTSGCVPLNLALSGKGLDGGWARGRVVNIVGDGSSGKTLLALELGAVAYYLLRAGKIVSDIWPTPDNVEFVYNNAEGVMDFPVERMYGKDFYSWVNWLKSPTVEHFGHDFFNRAAKVGKKQSLIYVIDSWDSLDSEEDLAKFDKELKATFKPKSGPGSGSDSEQKQAGSYELGKQKYASKRFFKTTCNRMLDKDITLVIISQVRSRIGITFGEKHYRSGGDALNFYTHQVAWLAEVAKLHKQALGKKRVYGIQARARLKRSKVSKPFRDVDFDIIFDYGVDDVGTMMNWFFGPKKDPVIWDGISYDRTELERQVRTDRSVYEALAIDVEKVWHKIDQMTNPLSGQSKYGG